KPLVTEPGKSTLFSAKNSFDEDDSKLQFTWKIDDAAPKTGMEVNHSFQKNGTYSFTLTSDDGNKLANSVQTVEGTIRVNAPPILVTEKRIVSNSQSIRLDASKSYDPDGSTLAFTWILPDGSKRKESAFTWQAP